MTITNWSPVTDHFTLLVIKTLQWWWLNLCLIHKDAWCSCYMVTIDPENLWLCRHVQQIMRANSCNSISWYLTIIILTFLLNQMLQTKKKKNESKPWWSIEVWSSITEYDSVSMKWEKGLPDWIMQTYLGRALSERDVCCIANEKIKDNSKREVWEGLQNIYFKNLSYDRPLYGK